jgi:hypothetical protein
VRPDRVVVVASSALDDDLSSSREVQKIWPSQRRALRPLDVAVLLTLDVRSDSTGTSFTYGTQKEENRAVMAWSCYGPCVVLKDEAVAIPWGEYEGAIEAFNDPSWVRRKSSCPEMAPTSAPTCARFSSLQ